MCGPSQTLYPPWLRMNSQGIHYATLQRTTPTAGTPPRHCLGAVGVLAPRALLAARDVFQILPYVQLLKSRVLHRGCPVEGLRHGLSFQPQEEPLPSSQPACCQPGAPTLVAHTFGTGHFGTTCNPRHRDPRPAAIAIPTLEGMQSLPSISHRSAALDSLLRETSLER